MTLTCLIVCVKVCVFLTNRASQITKNVCALQCLQEKQLFSKAELCFEHREEGHLTSLLRLIVNTT